MTFIASPGFEASVFNSTSPLILGDGVDAHGNLWCSYNIPTNTGVSVKCIDQTGTVLASYTSKAFQDEICTYILANQFPATSWVDTAEALGYSGVVAVLKDGGRTYLVFYWASIQSDFSLFFDCIAVYSTAADGSKALLGAVWTSSGEGALTAHLYTLYIGLCGAKTFNDPIFVWTQDTGNLRAAGRTFPSINEIIGKCSGFTGHIYRFSTGNSHTTYYNLGANTALDYGINATGSFPAFGAPIFVMPYTGGTTRFFSYWGKSSMATNHAQYLASNWLFACMWVEENAYGTYPNGCMIASSLGVVSNPAFVITLPTVNSTTITPAIAPGVLGGHDAFTDVDTYADGTGAPVLPNDYFPVPSLLSKQAGLYTTGWYHPYFIDNTYIVSPPTNWTFLAKLRVMDYNPSTGAFVDTFLTSGGLSHIQSIDPAGGGHGATFDFIDVVSFVAFWSNNVLKIWNVDWTSGTSSAPQFTWLAHFGHVSIVEVGQVITAGCTQVLVTAVNDDGTYNGTVVGSLGDVLLDDPNAVPTPIVAGEWSVSTPMQTFSGLDHLEGKEVWALADGLVVGPLTVAAGAVDLGFEASSVVVGLRYTQQVKTLYLTTDGIQAGSDQGKRKQLSGVTLRVDCTRGLLAGDSFDYLTPIPDLVLAGTQALFTGDARTLTYPNWDTKGEVCIEQRDPLPAQVLGVIVEVTPGDTGR